MKPTIGIVGGGIGGLTAAIALKQKGFSVQVYEQAPMLTVVGAGIALASNAMQVYQALGLDKALKSKGRSIHSLHLTDGDFVPLSKTNLREVEARYGAGSLGIHRADLIAILAEAYGKESLFMDKKLVALSQEKGVALRFEDGSLAHCDILIGADGIHSEVREALFPNARLRDSGQVCWRGVTEFHLPQKFQHQLTESWYGGSRFGFMPIDDERVYWFAVDKQKKGANKHSLDEVFQHFHPLVKDIIGATETEKIHEAPLLDLIPIASWTQGSICLLGDAAHATTPNLGQGACQSVEDAFVLAQCMENQKEPSAALNEYERLRKSKAQRVVRTSWSLGKMAHWEQPLASVRNMILRMTPAFVARKQSEWLFDIGL